MSQNCSRDYRSSSQPLLLSWQRIPPSLIHFLLGMSPPVSSGNGAGIAGWYLGLTRILESSRGGMRADLLPFNSFTITHSHQATAINVCQVSHHKHHCLQMNNFINAKNFIRSLVHEKRRDFSLVRRRLSSWVVKWIFQTFSTRAKEAYAHRPDVVRCRPLMAPKPCPAAQPYESAQPIPAWGFKAELAGECLGPRQG